MQEEYLQYCYVIHYQGCFVSVVTETLVYSYYAIVIPEEINESCSANEESLIKLLRETALIMQKRVSSALSSAYVLVEASNMNPDQT